MKKLSILIASLALAIPAFSQNEEAPNRLILTDAIGNYHGYVLDRVKDLTFARIDGEVKADVKIIESGLEELTVSVIKTPSCYSYILDIIPANTANQYDDLTIISYLGRYEHTRYYDDYPQATLSGIELEPATDYVLVTVGYDGYGIADGVSRAPFSTPKPEIAGSPEVKAEVVDTQLKSFSVKFTPNDDVLAYYCVAGEKGTLEEQFQMFGPMMGLSSMADLIMSWGLERTGEQTVTWNDMSPNTEYEVYYLALDVNGNPDDYNILELSTLALGGEGEAKVDIKIGDYEYADWGGEMKPSQYITFTPNDQASCYRFGVYTAEIYDGSTEEIKDELRSDPPMPMAYWFFYDAMTTDFQIDPNTECVAIGAAKNVNGEWGEITEVRFTTPAKAEGDPGVAGKPVSNSKDVKTRMAAKKSIKSFDFTPGKVPAIRKQRKLQLN